ncbi:hypothetical protein MMC26_001697 [Xylographa opegraphella]|nr:hypothetical protein [Xylographa opegraphella]
MDSNTSTLSSEDLYATQGPKLDIIAIMCFSLAVIAVCLRFLSRAVIKASFWWDDFVILLALVLALGPLALTLYLVSHNFGQHAEVAGAPSVLTFYKCLYAFEILYPLPIAATKFSILFYYSRIFQVPSFQIPLYLVAGLIGCWVLYVEGAAMFSYVPVNAMWDPSVTGRCINIHSFFIGIAVPNIVTDIALLTMPLPYIWWLQVAWPKKIAVILVFTLGGFVAVVSIIRLTVLLNLTNQDVTWTYVPTCIWTNIEVHIGIVSASVPAFWPLPRAVATGSVHPASPRDGQHSSAADPNNGLTNRFIAIGRRMNNSNEEGFVQLTNIGNGSKRVEVEERAVGPHPPLGPGTRGRVEMTRAWRG